MELLIGSVGLTTLTHPLSFQIMEMISNSVNVGWNLILLNLCKAQDCPPSEIPDPYYSRDGLSRPWNCPSPAL